MKKKICVAIVYILAGLVMVGGALIGSTAWTVAGGVMIVAQTIDEKSMSFEIKAINIVIAGQEGTQ